MITNIKNAIDFAILATTPNSWDHTRTQINNLGTYLRLCQDKIDGMTTPRRVNPNSSKKLKELKRKITAKINQLENQKTKTSRSERKELDRRIKELKDGLKELETIIASSVQYTFQTGPEPQFEYDNVSNKGTIKYDGSIGSLMNELKHAFQFETGKIDFVKMKGPKGPLDIYGGLIYDIQDELETYKRQYAYDGILKFSVELNNSDFTEGKFIDLKSLGKIEIKKMNQITASVVMKISDGIAKKALYKNLSTKSLDTNSPIKDVIRGNKNRKSLINSVGIKSYDKNTPYIEFIKVYSKSKPLIYVK